MPTKTASELEVADQVKRNQEEIDRLPDDIRRIGPTYPAPMGRVLFGELFDDDEVQNTYEALVATLRNAKKRGIITFKGQMLLQGVHNKVVISIVGEEPTEEEDLKENLPKTPVQRPKRTPAKKFKFFPKTPTPSPAPPPTAPKTSPLVIKKSVDIHYGIASDTESEVSSRTNPRAPPPLSVASDSESDGRTTASPRRRVRRGKIQVPPAFRFSSQDQKGRPPTPWTIRKAQSEAALTETKSTTRRWARERKASSPRKAKKSSKVADETEKKGNASTTPAASMPPEVSARTPPPPVAAKAKSENNMSSAAFSRMDEEVQQIVDDITRLGSNPGEPNVTFGELFDDDEVQNKYEALVGTLRSAKRQGLINFKGQMLFKGMHDNVVIQVVETSDG